ncbi:hypothetical protein JGC56_13680 [Salmonella enterica subsp. enterica serovar Saintpaul]|nr:hypothetical protein [Salmonella enterica subsp. enterica serovar Saintpaul]
MTMRVLPSWVDFAWIRLPRGVSGERRKVKPTLSSTTNMRLSGKTSQPLR